MIDLDEIERIANAGDAYGHVTTCATVLALIAEVRRLRDGEPNMRHQKIQHLLSQKARLAIELSIVESLVTDPEYEPTPMDGDYWSTLCDKVSDMAKAARGAK